MKKLLALLLVGLVLAGCTAADKITPSALDRDTILPLSFLCDLAGAPMKLACDRRNDKTGHVIWAWEEDGGPGKLIYLELYLKPADGAALYAKAAKDAKTTIQTVAHVQAVGNGRATFALDGDYYMRIVMLGVERENEETAMLIDWLAGALAQTEE